MAHSDDAGLILPPRIAPVQAVIVPILGPAADPTALLEAGASLQRELQEAGVACTFDRRDHKPGYKFFEWEQKGVPLRFELGPRDLERQQVTCKPRFGGDKVSWARDGLASRARARLDAMQTELLQAARTRQQQATVEVDDYDSFREIFAGNNSCFVMAHWDGSATTEAKIKEDTRATLRCIPLQGEAVPGRCVVSGAPSPRRVLFAKAY